MPDPLNPGPAASETAPVAGQAAATLAGAAADLAPALYNLAFYRFVDLGEGESLAVLRDELRELARGLELRGTVLIAPEGLNAMVTGTRAGIDALKRFAEARFGVEAAAFKEAPVDAHSFNRMLVKIKREIIPVGDPALRPAARTARRISAAELKRWLDEARDITLLDTRNDYEVAVGTFRGAEDLALSHSREFGHEASRRLAEWRSKPVVTFCTGGIRCEKASALLLKLGLDESQVYQLDGGILRYFEENGAEHFRGNCFVFDWRLAVDGELRPAPRAIDPNHDQGFGRHRVPKPE